MANRRMFTLDIIDDDSFLDMPCSAQNLYFHIAMRSDDDGICSKVNKTMAICGANKNDLDILFAKKFLLPTDIGVVIVKGWWLHNTKRKDTYKPSTYLNKIPSLFLDENRCYTFHDTGFRYLSVNEPLTQDKISKDKISKDKISKDKEQSKDCVGVGVCESKTYSADELREMGIDEETITYYLEHGEMPF